MEAWLSRISQTCSDGRVKGNYILSRVYHTAADMLRDRGFVVTWSAADTDQLLEAVERGDPVLRAQCGAQHASVYIDKDDRTGVKTVRGLVDKNGPETQLVVISLDGPTPFCKKEIGESLAINFFMIKELTYNVTRHVLVPPHRRLTDAETERMLTTYSALPSQLPLLLMNDPVRRYYNWPPDAIIEIDRTGMTQETCKYYRRVHGRRSDPAA